MQPLTKMTTMNNINPNASESHISFPCPFCQYEIPYTGKMYKVKQDFAMDCPSCKKQVILVIPECQDFNCPNCNYLVGIIKHDLYKLEINNEKVFKTICPACSCEFEIECVNDNICN